MALLRGQVAPHGGARLYGGRTRGGERLGRRLGDERPQQVGRHARTAQHLAAQFEEVVGEIAGEDPRQMHLPAQGRVGIEHRAAQAAGEGLHLAAQVVQRLVDSLTQKPWLGLFGTAKVNVLRLNIALETLQPNVTASAGVRQAGGCGEGVSPEN